MNACVESPSLNNDPQCKVEPLRGEPMRFLAGRAFNIAFEDFNKGKRSIAIDLKNPKSREALKRLMQWADVLTVRHKIEKIHIQLRNKHAWA